MYFDGLAGLEMSKADADALSWQAVRYRPTVITGGVNDVSHDRTYVEPSGEWLASIGFTGPNSHQRIELPVNWVTEGYGEQSQQRPAPPDDQRALLLIKDAVNEGYAWYTTPIIQFEKARGLTQQVAYRGGMRYYRYVDSSGKQVGALVEFPPGGDAVVGKIVKVLAIAMIGTGVAQAASAAASSITAPSGAVPAGAAPTAGAGAGTAATAAVPAAALPAATGGGGGLLTSAGGALSTVGSVVKAVGGAAAAAAPVVAKVAPAVGAIIKATSPSPQPLPIAPPASSISTPFTPTTPFGPLAPQPVYDSSIFASSRQDWLLPVLVGGGFLLLMTMMGNRRNEPTKPTRRSRR